MQKIFLTIATIFFAYTFYAQRQNSVFMFSYFNNNGKTGLHLACSNDGYTWTALNNDKSFLQPGRN